MSRRGIPETVKLVHEQEDLITDLRRRLDAAEARALTAEHEVEVVREERVKYGNGYYVENARAEMATARAERADAAEADLRARLAATERDAKTAWQLYRSEQADHNALNRAAGEMEDRIRALAEMYKSEWLDNNGGQFFETCYSDLLAALDSPPRAGRFEELLAAEHEQFDQRGELLKSITEYKDAPSGTVSAPPAEPAIDVVTGQPCTIYVPPEDCTDPHRCRVHRGAYPAPAPTEETRNA